MVGETGVSGGSVALLLSKSLRPPTHGGRKQVTGACSRVAVLALMAGALMAWAQEVKDFSRAIEAFKAVSVVEPFFEGAYGYAVWDRIARGGFGVGAATGRGQVYVDGDVVGFSRMIDVSLGFQFGGRIYRQVIFFKDQAAFEAFTNGGFEFDAQAAAVAVTATVQASSGTQGSQASVQAAPTVELAAGAEYHDGLRVFTMTVGGLMYQASIAGQRYGFRALR